MFKQAHTRLKKKKMYFAFLDCMKWQNIVANVSANGAVLIDAIEMIVVEIVVLNQDLVEVL